MTPSIRYLILALTDQCNLRCSTCYRGDPSSPANMPEKTIRQAVEIAAATGTSFHLQLTGGEPTLVPAAIETAVSSAKETGRCRSIGIQTNGTRLTPTVLELIQTNQIQVGVSLDGPPDIHQQQRGLAVETIRGLQRLENKGIPFRVTTVVTQYNVSSLYRLVLILAGFSCARGIGLDLLVNKGRAGKDAVSKSAEPSSLTRGLRKMISVLEDVNDHRHIPIRFREQDLIKKTKWKKNAFCHACGAQSMAVDPKGRLFPCGQTMGDTGFFAGTIWQPQFENLNFLKTIRPQNAACDQCDLDPVCPGDCPSRLYYNRKKNPDLVCTLYRTIAAHSSCKVAQPV